MNIIFLVLFGLWTLAYFMHIEFKFLGTIEEKMGNFWFEFAVFMGGILLLIMTGLSSLSDLPIIMGIMLFAMMFSLLLKSTLDERAARN